MSVDINSLEPNSHKYKAEKEKADTRERAKPIVNRDQIVSTKKPLSKKFSETFMTEDVKDVKTWFLLEVLIPGIKNTILDMLSMMLFGEVSDRRGRERGRSRGRERVNYRSSYESSSSNSRRDRERRRYDDRYDSDDKVDFRNIVLKNRDDAENVIEDMRDRIKKNGSVSVAELLDLVDVPGRYTDFDYGWDDERDIGIRRVSSGYLIDVAEPRYIS